MISPRLRRHLKIQTANNFLLVAIILVNGYIVAAPVFPMVSFWWNQHFHHTSQQLSDNLHKPTTPTPNKPAVVPPKTNRLIVPAMQLNTQIFEGPDMHTLNKGIWHRPGTSSPDKGGNTVIAGHRFTWTDPQGIFYYLNKVKKGDEIGVWWQQKRYLYRVTTVKVVPPTEISVEDNTTDSRLTLYTCTPLWSPHQRLVVVAELESNS
jgi:sortase A